jgi:hypothetical protein
MENNMSILERYGKLPTVEEMMEALANPIVPPSAASAGTEIAVDEISTDDMIKEIFSMMKSSQYGGGSGGGGMSGGCEV